MVSPAPGRRKRAAARRPRRAALAAAVAAAGLALAVRPAGAGAPLTLPASGTPDDGAVLRWDVGRYADAAIPYRIQPLSPPGANPVAPPGSSAADRVDAVRAAFQAWEALPQAALRFRYEGTTASANAFDLENVVTFAPQNFAFPPAFPGGMFPIVTFAFSAGPVSLPDGRVVDASFAGEILDADVVVNPDGDFTLAADGPPPAGVFDVQGVLTHEVGHLSGLDHEGVVGNTLYGFFTPSGGFFGRTPETGDAASLAALYPEPAFLGATGRIAGTVTRTSDGAPVFGAHVVAVDRATGVVAASGMTGLAALGPDGLPARFLPGSGDFLLSGVPPGQFDVVAEPLDGPGVPYMSGVFGDGAGGASNLDIAFAPAVSATPVSVGAAGLVAGVNLEVGVRDPLAPNLAAFGFGSATGGPYVDPPQLLPGRLGFLSLGLGENLASGDALVPGAAFSVQRGAAGGVSLGAASVFFGISIPVLVAADAPPGPRLLVASTPHGVSTFAGAFSVVTAFPAPDGDVDGMPDARDSCPAAWNREQADADRDGVGDACDVCPFAADPDQADGGGVGAAAGPDGIGDACQCGDVSGDGRVTLADAVALSRSLLTPPAAAPDHPERCDVGGAPGAAGQACTLADAVLIRRALLSPAGATLTQACAPARP